MQPLYQEEEYFDVYESSNVIKKNLNVTGSSKNRLPDWSEREDMLETMPIKSKRANRSINHSSKLGKESNILESQQ